MSIGKRFEDPPPPLTEAPFGTATALPPVPGVKDYSPFFAFLKSILPGTLSACYSVRHFQTGTPFAVSLCFSGKRIIYTTEKSVDSAGTVSVKRGDRYMAFQHTLLFHSITPENFQDMNRCCAAVSTCSACLLGDTREAAAMINDTESFGLKLVLDNILWNKEAREHTLGMLVKQTEYKEKDDMMCVFAKMWKEILDTAAEMKGPPASLSSTDWVLQQIFEKCNTDITYSSLLVPPFLTAEEWLLDWHGDEVFSVFGSMFGRDGKAGVSANHPRVTNHGHTIYTQYPVAAFNKYVSELPKLLEGVYYEQKEIPFTFSTLKEEGTKPLPVVIETGYPEVVFKASDISLAMENTKHNWIRLFEPLGNCVKRKRDVFPVKEVENVGAVLALAGSAPTTTTEEKRYGVPRGGDAEEDDEEEEVEVGRDEEDDEEEEVEVGRDEEDDEEEEVGGDEEEGEAERDEEEDGEAERDDEEEMVPIGGTRVYRELTEDEKVIMKRHSGL